MFPLKGKKGAISGGRQIQGPPTKCMHLAAKLRAFNPRFLLLSLSKQVRSRDHLEVLKHRFILSRSLLGEHASRFLKPLPMARSPFPRPSLWPSRPTHNHVSHILRVKSLKTDNANRENGPGLTCDMLMVPVARVLNPRIVRFLYRFRRWSMMWSWLPSRLRKWGYWNGNQESHNYICEKKTIPRPPIREGGECSKVKLSLFFLPGDREEKGLLKTKKRTSQRPASQSART